MALGTGPESGRLAGIDSEEFSIGAAADNLLPLASDPHVSAYHAVIRFQYGMLMIHDLNSTNGLVVNNERFHSSACNLQPGDIIGIGATTLELRVAVGDA